MKRIIFGIGRALGATGRATVALVGICGVVAALANYTMTQGSGTSFGSLVVSTVHYAQQLLCDPTTPSQCAAVSSGGSVSVADASVLAAIQSPLAGVTTAQTSAAASSLVAKASAGSVVSVSGSAVSGSFIMVFNATSAPADGAVTPLKCFGPMSAAGPFTVAWGVGPVLTMSTGITVVSSSTGCFTKTATNAAFLSVEYQ